jgi:hypothetical protein
LDFFIQLKHVLSSFGLELSAFHLEDDTGRFQKILRAGFLLEFANVVLVK